MSTPTTTAAPSIEIPRLPDETPRAYAARVAYLTMGPGRSLARLGQDSGKHTTLYEQWSVKYGWRESAAQYDATLATLSAQRHAEEYQRDVERLRADARKVGGELEALGRSMMAEIASRRATMEYKPGDLATAVRAILAGFDVQAHALDLDKLLGSLSTEGGEDA